MKECMTKFRLSIALAAGLVAFVAVPAFAFSDSASKNESQAAQTATNKHTNQDQQNIGEQKFKQNCSRCHKAPEGFPPSITGTILKHMRVRASLSQEDERAILRFLNP